jgi:hypothetical protein
MDQERKACRRARSRDHPLVGHADGTLTLTDRGRVVLRAILPDL